MNIEFVQGIIDALESLQGNKAKYRIMIEMLKEDLEEGNASPESVAHCIIELANGQEGNDVTNEDYPSIPKQDEYQA